MDDLLVARYLGESTGEARDIFQRLWTWLRPRLLGCPACPPRIWAT
jgi:urease accessory protein